MKIGNIETKNNVFLAPMAGVTDMTFRKICREAGAGLTYTEMVSAKGLFYNDKKTPELLSLAECERPSAAQIFGSEPDIISAVCEKALSHGSEILDINMGCPAPKIVNNGDGSALLKNPDLVGKITAAAVKGANGAPVTVKIRAGWDDNSVNAVEIAKIIEANGADAITIHPRTRMMFYSGKADWGLISAVKKAVSIPVIGNGDIFCADDAVRMFAETGCDAVMVGRGAQGNPFIFKQINALIESGISLPPPTPEERLLTAINHAKGLCAEKGESRGIKEARKHFAWYIKGLHGSSALKVKLFEVTSLAQAEDIIGKALEEILRN